MTYDWVPTATLIIAIVALFLLPGRISHEIWMRRRFEVYSNLLDAINSIRNRRSALIGSSKSGLTEEFRKSLFPFEMASEVSPDVRERVLLAQWELIAIANKNKVTEEGVGHWDDYLRNLYYATDYERRRAYSRCPVEAMKSSPLACFLRKTDEGQSGSIEVVEPPTIGEGFWYFLRRILMLDAR